MALIRFRFLLAGIVPLFAPSTFAQQYMVTDLGTLGGSYALERTISTTNAESVLPMRLARPG
jgi:hypothetical protein